MLLRPITRRLAIHGASIMAAASLFFFAAPAANAQSGEPIKIGFGMSLTGPLAANGKSALLAMKISFQHSGIRSLEFT